MLIYRPSSARGRTQTGWLDGRHTFSFGHYRDPEWAHFGALRVINEDRVASSSGFPPHDHENMEIITIVLSGALSHQDSLGNAATIRPNEIQMMRAGTGIEHSEFNASKTEPVHLLQIWIMPHTRGLKPGYQQRALNASERAGKWQTVVAPIEDNIQDAFDIAADARLSLAALLPQQSLAIPAEPKRKYWLQVASGNAKYGNQILSAGDGLGISGEPSANLVAAENSELLLFDLAA